MAAIQRGELEGSADWPIAILRPGPEPLESLAIATALAIGGEKTPAAIRGQIEELRQSERALHLRTRLAMSESPQRRLALLVDQFEEVFTQCQDQKTRQALIDNLMVAATEPGGQTIVVMTLRADLYGECSAYPVLSAALSDHQVLIGPMQEAEQRRAIERPALLAGAEFERGLVNDLLDEVRNQPGSLPSLQYTLLELWQRREGRRITHAAYQEIGRVAGALERRAEEVYAQFSEPERLILRRICLRLVQSMEGGQAARRRVRLGELMPADGDRTAVERVVTKLAGPHVRLLTMEAAEGPSPAASQSRQVVDIAHEALIRNWPRLQQWLDEDREFQLWQKRLNVSQQEWERTARHPDALLRGALLDEAKRWIETRSNDLNSDEKDFVEAGLFLEKMREEEELAQQKQMQEAQHLRLKAETERAEEQTRSAKRLRKLALGLALLFLAAVGAAVFARRQMNVANRERAISSSLALATVSEGVPNADLRVLLALNAVAASGTRDAEGALYRAVQALEGPRFYTTGQPYTVLGMTFSPDSKLLATANTDNSVAVWNAQDGTRLGEPLKIEGGAENVAFRADGALAVATSRGAVKMIDPSGKMLQPDIAVAKKEVNSLAFSSGGARLAIGSADFSAAIWDFPAGPLRPLAGHEGPVRAVAFSPDARYLLTASVDGTAIGWDTGSAKQIFKLGTRDGAALLSMALSPSGKTAATGDASGRVRVWEIPSGRLLQEQRHSELKKVQALAFSADGHTLASASQDGTLKLWDATEAGLRERIAIPCGAGDQAEGCTALAFMMDGHTLAVAGKNGEVRRYETNFDKLLTQASSMVDPKQVSADDCMKYLQKTCEAAGEFTRAK
jgi:FOG: WD40 repeat